MSAVIHVPASEIASSFLPSGPRTKPDQPPKLDDGEVSRTPPRHSSLPNFVAEEAIFSNEASLSACTSIFSTARREVLGFLVASAAPEMSATTSTDAAIFFRVIRKKHPIFEFATVEFSALVEPQRAATCARVSDRELRPR